ncbi:hypothetical protein [Kibdelosporangium aridum]|uniref:hypothetical protein n=1 Tax=Kibdelosporangium aridum TaxID=2030 RepID=UPI00117ADDF0|nr:hypothetical protein [Kibdelosporangium aridum]
MTHSTGPRQFCPGAQMASTELRMALAILLTRFLDLTVAVPDTSCSRRPPGDHSGPGGVYQCC